MLLVLVSSCQEDDKTFGAIVAPTNLTISYEIAGKDAANPDGDGSGKVILKATADNATSYKFLFSDETSENSPTGEYTKQFTKNGVNTYTVTAVAYGTGGTATNTSIEVTVYSDFSDPEALQFLTAGSSKTWYWAASKQGHLGVGPNDNSEDNAIPKFYGAAPFEKESGSSSCLYLEKLIFSLDGETIKFKLDTNGSVFFNSAYNSVGGSSATDDQCLTYDTSTLKTVSLGPSNSVVPVGKTRGTTMTFADNGFMGYYVGATSYEILKITETEMQVRAVMGNNPSLAWYHTFTTKTIEEQKQASNPEPSNLVFSDEFDVDGAPDASKWTMELGTGQSGWGNNEAQSYKAENAVVSGGMLKITAKAEAFDGKQYTSARMKTEGKFDFKYGKIEIRAKLPKGSGTWPALWMLGANYATQQWPACGELDMMEHIGNKQGEVHATLHYPGHSGAGGVGGFTNIPDVSETFHIYKTIWDAEKIRFFIDDTLYYTFANDASKPFNANFFLILNVAMGGNYGGAIAPGFVSSAMEVDYVKVFQ